MSWIAQSTFLVFLRKIDFRPLDRPPDDSSEAAMEAATACMAARKSDCVSTLSDVIDMFRLKAFSKGTEYYRETFERPLTKTPTHMHVSAYTMQYIVEPEN